MNYRDVPGWCDFEDIYAEQVKAAPTDRRAIFVELGVCFGRSAICMAEMIRDSGKAIDFFAIDHWGPEDIPDNVKWRALAAQHAQPGWPGTRGAFEYHATACGVRDLIEVRQSDSVAAAPMFAPASIDFLFLDTSHTERATRLEITAWLPKIRPGGVFAGHDYDPPHVYPGLRKAVDEMLPGAVVRGTSFFWRVPGEKG